MFNLLMPCVILLNVVVPVVVVPVVTTIKTVACTMFIIQSTDPSRFVTDDSRKMLFIVTSLTDESRAIIYVYSTGITYDDFQMMVILCLLFTLRQP